MISVARTYTVKPTWTTLQFFVSYRDTECYAAIQTQWPLFRPPATAAPQTKATRPVSSTSTSDVLFEVMPPGLVNTEGSRKLLAGWNPAGSVPAIHISVVVWVKFQIISTVNPFLRKATKSSEKLLPYKNRKPTSRDTECYAGHAAQHEKLYCPDRPVPPKLEMNISPEGLIQSPAEYS